MTKHDNISIKKNVLLNTIGMCVYFACQWLISIMVVRMSNFDNAGMYSLALSYTNVFYILSSFSTKQYQVSDLKGKYGNEIYLTTRVITCVFSFILCTICLTFADYSFEEKVVILLFLIYKLTESYVDVYHGIEQLKWKLEYVACSYILRGIGNLGSFCIGILYTRNIAVSILLMLLCNLIVICFYDHRMIKKINVIKLQLNIRQISNLLYSTLPLLLNAFLVTFASVWPRLVLEKYYGKEILGVFSSILAPALLIPVVINVFTSPLINIYSKIYQERKIRRIMLIIILSILGYGIIGVVCYAITGIIGEKVLILIYTDQIKSYSHLLVPLVMFTTATAYTYLLSGLAIAIREMKGIIISGIVGTILVLSLSKIIETREMVGTAFVLLLMQTAQIVVLVITLLFKLKQEMNSITE